jgi:hypothetical protein
MNKAQALIGRYVHSCALQVKKQGVCLHGTVRRGQCARAIAALTQLHYQQHQHQHQHQHRHTSRLLLAASTFKYTMAKRVHSPSPSPPPLTRCAKHYRNSPSARPPPSPHAHVPLTCERLAFHDSLAGTSPALYPYPHQHQCPRRCRLHRLAASRRHVAPRRPSRLSPRSATTRTSCATTAFTSATAGPCRPVFRPLSMT